MFISIPESGKSNLTLLFLSSFQYGILSVYLSSRLLDPSFQIISLLLFSSKFHFLSLSTFLLPLLLHFLMSSAKVQRLMRRNQNKNQMHTFETNLNFYLHSRLPKYGISSVVWNKCILQILIMG